MTLPRHTCPARPARPSSAPAAVRRGPADSTALPVTSIAKGKKAPVPIAVFPARMSPPGRTSASRPPSTASSPVCGPRPPATPTPKPSPAWPPRPATGPVAELTYEDYAAVMDRWSGVAPATWNRHLSALVSFTTWAQRQDLLETNPARRLTQRTPVRRGDRAIGYARLERLSPDDRHPLRERGHRRARPARGRLDAAPAAPQRPAAPGRSRTHRPGTAGQVPPPEPVQPRPLPPPRRGDLRPHHRRTRSRRPPAHPLTAPGGLPLSGGLPAAPKGCLEPVFSGDWRRSWPGRRR
jgi:hypothetical protein